MSIFGQNLKSLGPLQPKLAKLFFWATSWSKFQNHFGPTYQQILYGYIWSKSEVFTITAAKVSTVVLLSYQLTKILKTFGPTYQQKLYGYIWSKFEVFTATAAKVSKIVLLSYQLTKIPKKIWPNWPANITWVYLVKIWSRYVHYSQS